ncbi:MAG TPA: NAD(P)/FAD-dependent oxidoreductase [Solirubrobacteraceae bacterium]|nr:NAD(P)/FAD-dependent oxidoreductase [Solirubrobacteraceae bacterium]
MSILDLPTSGAPAPEGEHDRSIPHVRIAIVGTGFAGLGLAIRLRQQGIEDFVLIERADDVGGTWQANTYPGCQCDVPSHLYSFSFAPNPDWTRTYSHQREIWQYLRDLAAEHDLYPRIRFGHDLTGAAWDSDRGLWSVETSQGAWTAHLLIDATGPLSYPAVPRIRGIGSFKGTMFHSAQWDHDHDLTGERVAVIGTGASAIQFVPQIADTVGRMHVFQRTAPWILPHTDRPTTRVERRLYKTFPFLQKAVRSAVYLTRESYALGFIKHPKLMSGAEKIAAAHLRKQVKDPQLRRRLAPRFRLGCKRVLMSNTWYPTLTRDDVELVTEGIEAVRGNTIHLADGSTREVDTIIFGTGFHVTDPPSARLVRGRDGATLADRMQSGIQAYLGATVEGLPNYFKLIGPNTGLGHNSMVYMIESHINYVMDALRVMEEQDIAEFEVRPDVMASYNAMLQSKLPGTVWLSGCASWYLDADGRNVTLWPDYTFRFRHRTRRFKTNAYTLRHATDVRAGAEAAA